MSGPYGPRDLADLVLGLNKGSVLRARRVLRKQSADASADAHDRELAVAADRLLAAMPLPGQGPRTKNRSGARRPAKDAERRRRDKRRRAKAARKTQRRRR